MNGRIFIAPAHLFVVIEAFPEMGRCLGGVVIGPSPRLLNPRRDPDAPADGPQKCRHESDANHQLSDGEPSSHGGPHSHSSRSRTMSSPDSVCHRFRCPRSESPSAVATSPTRTPRVGRIGVGSGVGSFFLIGAGLLPRMVQASQVPNQGKTRQRSTDSNCPIHSNRRVPLVAVAVPQGQPGSTGQADPAADERQARAVEKRRRQ
jgi:hypothetical protein